jgi:hypothetical protein
LANVASTRALDRAFRRALLIPRVCGVFERLGVGASIWIDGYWAPIHEEPSVVAFELEHDSAARRHEYNQRCIERARRTRATHLGEHAGFSDLFVPIVLGGEARAFLICGPFADTPPTAAAVLVSSADAKGTAPIHSSCITWKSRSRRSCSVRPSSAHSAARSSDWPH